MPPRMRSPTFAPAAARPTVALVSAVLAIIDRIGEMVAAIDAGEEMPGGSDEALIEALAEGAEGPAAPVATTIAEAQGKIAAPRTIRLSVELLDRVMSGVSDMVLARNELARRLRESPTDVPIDGAFERLSGIIAEMRDAITRTRMQRIENLFVGLPRMVRDLSAELGKQVLVDIEGGDVELDREMIEMIRDPLTHIIRNAVDHGIETPAERLKAGKREIGILCVSARQSGQPDPDRHPGRWARHRRQEAGREGDCGGNARQGRCRASFFPASNWR